MILELCETLYFNLEYWFLFLIIKFGVRIKRIGKKWEYLDEKKKKKTYTLR